MKTITVILFAVLSVLACTSASTSKPASATCSSDSECSSGACLDLAVFNDGGCSSAGKACSKSCLNDADCAALGAKYKCFGGCGTTKSCGATP